MCIRDREERRFRDVLFGELGHAISARGRASFPAHTPEDRRRLLDAAERAALLRRRPRLVELCAELDAFGLPDTLDHCDLHDGQVLAPAPGRFTFFDWGDASVAHPFGSLLIPVRAVRERYGPEHVAPMVDAYLERWSGLGPSAPELRRAAALAVRLAALGRAGTWFRLFPGTPLADSHDSSAYWLRELFGAEDLTAV